MNTQVKVLTQVRLLHICLWRAIRSRGNHVTFILSHGLFIHVKHLVVDIIAILLMDFAEISLLMLISNNHSFLVKYLIALSRVSFVKNSQHIYLSNSQHFIIQCFLKDFNEQYLLYNCVLSNFTIKTRKKYGCLTVDHVLFVY